MKKSLIALMVGCVLCLGGCNFEAGGMGLKLNLDLANPSTKPRMSVEGADKAADAVIELYKQKNSGK